MLLLQFYRNVIAIGLLFFVTMSNAFTCSESFSSESLALIASANHDFARFGKKVLFPRFGSPLLGGTSTYKPLTGSGYYIVGRSSDYFRLFRAISSAPRFFAKFDLYLVKNVLIIPSADRLNPILKNGLRFKDRSFFQRQFYSSEQFRKSFAGGAIELGSRGGAFFHDRYEEHLMGALIMPPWLVEKLEKYAILEAAARDLKIFSKNRHGRKWLATQGSASNLYDIITAMLGFRLEEISRAESERDLESATSNLARTLSDANAMLSLPRSTEWIQQVFGVSREEAIQGVQEVERIQRITGLTSISPAFAQSEAHRIAGEIRQ